MLLGIYMAVCYRMVALVSGTPNPGYDILVAAVGFLGTVVEEFHVLLHQPLASEVYDQWQDQTDEVSIKKLCILQ